MKVSNVSLLIILVLCGVLMSPEKVLAQKMVKVVTKTISQRLENPLDSGILVQGKKAEVQVMGWNENYIKVEMDLVAKHAKLQVAKEELEYIQYKISKKDERYVIENSFFSDRTRSRIKSSLSVVYRIFVPINTKVVVSNQYGTVSAANLFNSVLFDVKFCDVDFERLFGEITVVGEYSEFRGKNFNAELVVKSKRSDIDFKEFAGLAEINNNYGDIKLSPSPMLKALEVQSRHGKVDVFVSSLNAFNYDVRVNSSYINLPNTESNFVKENENRSEFHFQKRNGLNKANISITSLLYPVSIMAFNQSNN